MSPAFWTHPRRRSTAIGLGLAWIASLMLPAAYLTDGDAPAGISVLLIGWVGLLMLQPAWLGNLLIWIVLPLVAGTERPWKITLRLCGVAMAICAIGALFWRDLPDDSGPNNVLAFGPGYYLWMTAIVGSALAALATSLVETETI